MACPQEERSQDKPRFNPTMVRLWLGSLLSWPLLCPVSIPQWFDCGRVWLRTLYSSKAPVSIPQWFDCGPGKRTKRPKLYGQFQSHNGSIVAGVMPETILRDRTVSIPQWFDCGAARALRQIADLNVSIPQWFDCGQGSNVPVWPPRPVSIPQWFDCGNAKPTL